MILKNNNMKTKHMSICLLFSIILLGIFTSCDNWLDIEQDTEKKDTEMFKNYNGFKGALAGCYLSLTSSDLYGSSLTMSHLEGLAGLWYIQDDREKSELLHECDGLSRHDYSDTYSQNAIKRIYGALYNVILEANVVLKGCKEHGGNIPFPESSAVVEGEAYGLRALCHFELLRLFGQLPTSATKTVSLPYSEITKLEEVPAYYSYEEYVKKLEADLDKAVELMKDNDPICIHNYSDLYYMGKGNSDVKLDDEFMTNRRLRMNYWAIKALQARMYMYLGNKTKAFDLAMEVINAKTEAGKNTVSLSSLADYGTTGTDYSSSSECLFGLYITDMNKLSTPTLVGADPSTGTADDDPNNTMQVDPKKHLTLTEAWHKELFEGVNTATDIRFKKMWSMTTTNQGFLYPTIRKYYKRRNSANEVVAGTIPILRLSEMYLIATESSSSLAEANDLYAEYMVSKNVLVEQPFSSTEELNSELAKEYRREFFAEGQMFYYYKRHNMTKMWSKENVTVSENDYILPLPNTENNPNKKQS